MRADASIVIRSAVAEDAESLLALLRSLAESVGQLDKMTASRSDLLRHGFSATSAFDALLAEQGREIVGMCIYFPTFSTWRGEPGVYVQDLYVSGNARGNGLGRRLLAAAAAQAAQDHGATHMRLAVDVGNANAREFYAALGLRQRSDETTFQIDGTAYKALGDAAQ